MIFTVKLSDNHYKDKIEKMIDPLYPNIITVFFNINIKIDEFEIKPSLELFSKSYNLEWMIGGFSGSKMGIFCFESMANSIKNNIEYDIELCDYCADKNLNISHNNSKIIFIYGNIVKICNITNDLERKEFVNVFLELNKQLCNIFISLLTF